MKKKLLAIIMLSAIFALSGCIFLPSENESENTASPEASSPIEEIQTKEINYIQSPPHDTYGYEILSRLPYDLTGDGTADNLILYTSAERNMKGELLWDDTQEWVLQLQTELGYADLYIERIHGRAYVNVSDYYNDGKENKVITLYIAGKSFNEVREYTINKNSITEKIVYSTDNSANEGISTIYTSVPDYE